MPARVARWTARNFWKARLTTEARTVARSTVGDRKAGPAFPRTNTTGDSCCLREGRRRLKCVVKKGCEELPFACVDNPEHPVARAAG